MSTVTMTTYSVGEVARLAGVSSNAVRYYERYRVIEGSRTSGNARRFTVDAVCRIKLARAGQRIGLTLAESAEILAEIPPQCADLDRWLEAGRSLVVAGERRIDELRDAVEEFRTVEFLRS
ncbi:MAG: MerR family transcriptional regulator [Nocardioidaceae bacterium]|nr:MerR family transcriptional regulator [Nocardioidaceae bacterium]